jgi:spermidine/putrescine transport system ATP-binding protein
MTPPDTNSVVATAKANSAVVELRGAVKRFHTPEGTDVTALDYVNLSVGENEFVTLLGPSGCGKTTLLRCISGFEDLDEGSLAIGAVSMAGVPAHRRPVNTVFQNYALFPHMTVGANVAYSLEVAHVPREERRRRVADTLALVNLQGMEKRKPSQLSGGQQQRVALARAIISRPKILLLDEPLSALDRKLRQSMQLELKTLQHELGISFVFVTHDQEEALTMSDRVVVMDAGRIQQIGAPTEIYHRPDSAFVAEFIGESNLFDARVISVDGAEARFETSEGLVLLGAAENLSVGQRVYVLLRPEIFELLAEGAQVNPQCHGLSARLEQEVFLGTDYRLILRSEPGGKVLKVSLRDAHRRDLAAIAPGATIQLQYPRRLLHASSAAPSTPTNCAPSCAAMAA